MNQVQEIAINLSHRLNLVEKIWNLNPKNYDEWNIFCKNKNVYKEISNYLVNKNQTNLFKELCQLMIFENFRNFKLEYRAKLYLEKLGYSVKKSFLLLDIFHQIDLLAYKNESKFAFQIKSNNLEKDYKRLLNYCKKNKYIPIVLIITPDKIYWKNL